MIVTTLPFNTFIVVTHAHRVKEDQTFERDRERMKKAQQEEWGYMLFCGREPQREYDAHTYSQSISCYASYK